ncbi:MAG TPA: cytochrome P450 [Nocardioides sp.]|jgi:cytochrome P450|uniref:cytochrome P450 n=1 Tax=Nocardioides sp. TaxID=35761 RepID=UPI002E31277F|nr:cytochrome P450 [Nocardioides sp.]HEX3930500.1 cytochrome P450 [Nocardioides sp.]
MHEVDLSASMDPGDELSLDPMHASHRECPFPLYERLRTEAPVAYVPEHDFYTVATHDLCMRVLRDPATFRQWDGDEMFEPGQGPPLGRPSNWSPEVRAAMDGAHRPVSTLVNANPPRHTRYRKLANSLFSARRTADAMDARMHELVHELIDALPRDGAEFVSAFAVPFPIRVISEVLGFPSSEYATFKRWTDSAMVAIAGGVPTERLVTAASNLVEFQDYLLDIVEKRREQPTDDVVGYLANATVEDTDGTRLLRPEETIGLGLHLLTGGGETTTNLLGSLMLRLAETTGLAGWLGADLTRIPGFIEETLRMDSPFQSLFRRTTRPVSLGGVDLPEGAKVLVMFASANRDEQYFTDAAEFDAGRTGPSHIAFGFGTHFCLGAPLARRESLIAVEAIVTRLPEVRVRPGSAVIQNDHAFLRGLRHLEIEYDGVRPAAPLPVG